MDLVFCLPGSLNDLNVLDKSPSMGQILFGVFPPRVYYVINGVHQNFIYFLTNRIYPDYAIFVKTTANCGNTKKDQIFSGVQEAVRKDVERAFDILIAL